MNRTYAYSQTNRVGQNNGPIEEVLRSRFADRGLGAVSVNAARAAQSQGAKMRPTQPSRQATVHSVQRAQPRPAPNPRPQPASRAVVQNRSTAVAESRPHTTQKIPLYETYGRRTSMPVALLACLLICTMTVLSVVWGSAMVGRASDEVNQLQNQAAELAKTERELSQALDRKNDLRTIERIAVDELGMIGTDLITKKYITFSGIDVIEVCDDESENSVGLSTLLSAIGVNVK